MSDFERPVAPPAAPTGNLSAAGRRRRQAMLGELLDDLGTLRRTRAERRRMAMSGAVVAGVGAAVLLSIVGRGPMSPGPRPRGWPVGTGMIATAPQAPGVLAVTDPSISGRWCVRTDPDALRRYSGAAPVGAVIVEAIDDRSLVNELEAIGRPAGLIRSGGRVWLTAIVAENQGPASPVGG